MWNRIKQSVRRLGGWFMRFKPRSHSSRAIVPRPSGRNPIQDNLPGTGPYSILGTMRANLIRTEYFHETQSKTRRSLHIIRAGTRILESEETRYFADGGELVTTKNRFLIQTCEGRLITNANLQGGGQCTHCKGYTDGKNLAFCAICRQPLCFACGQPWQGLIVCPKHHQLLRFHYDTWEDS